VVFSDCIQEAISISNQVSNSVCYPAESTVDSERVPVWGEVEFSQIDHNFLTGSLLGEVLLSPRIFFLFVCLFFSSWQRNTATIQTNPSFSSGVK